MVSSSPQREMLYNIVVDGESKVIAVVAHLHLLPMAKSVYRDNWHCFLLCHVCYIAILGPCGCHFINPYLFKGKCFQPFLFAFHCIFVLCIAHLHFINDWTSRNVLLVVFAIYYLLLLCHMCCFVSESFESSKPWKKAKVTKKPLQV